MTKKSICFTFFLVLGTRVSHAAVSEYSCQQSNVARIENLKMTSAPFGNVSVPAAISFDVVSIASRFTNLSKSFILGPSLSGSPQTAPQAYEILAERGSYQVKTKVSPDLPWTERDQRGGTIYQGQLRDDGTFDWFAAELPIGALADPIHSITNDAGNIQVYCRRVEPRRSICTINPRAC